MRYIVTILLFLSFSAFASNSLDVDYNFIDSAFDGIKPVSDKQFNDTINKLTPQPAPTTFGGKLKTFLFGRKYGVETPQNSSNDETMDIGGERQAIKELTNGIYYIKLLVSIVSSDGTIIPLGNYKIQQEIKDNQKILVFYQGRDRYGSLMLNKFNDTQKQEHAITYSRVDIISDDIVRIVYATIEDTQCATAKIYASE